jgi:hypothetical protein
MAVIINEMEVVLETPKRAGIDPERLPTPPIPTLQPFDMTVIEEIRMKKEARLLAH